MDQVLRNPPNRTTPIIYFDANTEFGLQKTPWGTQKIVSRTLGDYNLGVENNNALPIRNFLENWGLYLITTDKSLPPPYVSGSHKTEKHIDHIALPLEAAMDTTCYNNVFVWLTSGRKLQPIVSPLRLDHSPVGIFVNSKTGVRQANNNNQIDRNQLMRCVLRGENRAQLFSGMTKECKNYEHMHNLAIKHKSATILYHMITKVMRTSAVKVLKKSLIPTTVKESKQSNNATNYLRTEQTSWCKRGAKATKMKASFTKSSIPGICEQN